MKTVNDFQLLTISAKSSVLDVGQGSKYASLKNFDPTQFQIKSGNELVDLKCIFFLKKRFSLFVLKTILLSR